MSEQGDAPEQSGWDVTRRRAGCLLGCLAEPAVIVWLMLGGALAGWIWKRRRSQPDKPVAPAKESDDD